jgi:site-specific DNA recombinase
MCSMKAPRPAGALRCAIYTRKSSEEGLDQAFNSLDAQREACEAYALSQRHEGWRVLPTRYDDGGHSGGTLARPALQRLLEDIQAGQVDLVVVYKIDRLTRSLMDFAKLVEVFDRQGASFVSVTQQFNTTSSMGRLTLNVLLSFAQFEREVTGERIRDKVAASRRKGMWMGGPAPLGYRVANKALVVEPEEAALVRRIFERYCALGCAQKLKDELEALGLCGKARTQRNGEIATRPLSRGALYAILQRRLYVGEVHHAGEHFPGQHEAIVPPELWEKAQALLASQRQRRRFGKNAQHGSLLAGMISDTQRRPLTATHTTKGGKRYRYYLRRDPAAETQTGSRLCLPAHDIERIAQEQWMALLAAPDLDLQLGVSEARDSLTLRATAQRLIEQWPSLPGPARKALLKAAGFHVASDGRRVDVSFDPPRLRNHLLGSPKDEPGSRPAPPRVTHTVDAALRNAGGETRVLECESAPVATALLPAHQTLLKIIAQGREWASWFATGKVACIEDIRLATGLSHAHVARGLKCLRIPPDLVSRLAAGSASANLTWGAVRRITPNSWSSAIESWHGN